MYSSSPAGNVGMDGYERLLVRLCEKYKKILSMLIERVNQSHKHVQYVSMRGSRGGWGQIFPDPTPCKITKLYESLEILVRIPWKITELPSQHSMLGHHQPTSETPLKWRFAGRPIIARLWCYLDQLFFPHQLKFFVRVGPPLTKLSGSAHGVCGI